MNNIDSSGIDLGLCIMDRFLNKGKPIKMRGFVVYRIGQTSLAYYMDKNNDDFFVIAYKGRQRKFKENLCEVYDTEQLQEIWDSLFTPLEKVAERYRNEE